MVRLDADEEKGLTVFLGAEFYPPAPRRRRRRRAVQPYDEKQPIVRAADDLRAGSASAPASPTREAARAPRKRTAARRQHRPAAASTQARAKKKAHV